LFIVNRGFRDVLDFRREWGFQVEMLWGFFFFKGVKHHSMEEANYVRVITKVRWVVESAMDVWFSGGFWTEHLVIIMLPTFTTFF